MREAYSRCEDAPPRVNRCGFYAERIWFPSFALVQIRSSQAGHVVVTAQKYQLGAVNGLTVPEPLQVGHGSASNAGSASM